MVRLLNQKRLTIGLKNLNVMAYSVKESLVQWDINPHDAKYKGVRSREAAVDKNSEIVTRSIVRRERMGILH